IIFFSFISSLVFGQNISNNSVVITIDKELINDTNCNDLSCKTLLIERLNNKSKVIILFPLGGSQTDVSLYLLKDYLEYKNDSKELDYVTKRRDSKVIIDGQPLTINMTDLEDNEYLVNYMSCNSHGLIKLFLKTKE
ncbi:MAG: hypothetical protein KDD24_04040, partial [Flavobacteriales bacterium]|nr:hypothetical protein [Flavobacteriales bacterium]